MFLKKVFAGIILVLCLFTFGDAIKCYQCQSDLPPGCTSPTVVDCNSKEIPKYLPAGTPIPTQCSEMMIKVGPNQSTTKRGCYFKAPGSQDKCIRDPNNPLNYATCETCDGDLCNSATKMYAFGTLLFVSILAYFLH